MGNITTPHGMKTFDKHSEDVDIELVNEEFYERLERMIRAGKGGEAPCWLSADLAMVLYRNVREDEGWYMRRTVTTMQELDELPPESVIRCEPHGPNLEKCGVGGSPGFWFWFEAGNSGRIRPHFPATVLYTPEASA